ncbi:glycerate kinase, partial [bacterium]|nr:glycerate kinase [bacterium]
AKEEDLILCLLSGGGSALLFAPVRGISLEEIAQLNAALLSCGAKIDEINAVRKHLSSVKGGQLAKRAYPARLVSLILSDVIGDPLDVIASGPTTGDESTFADALKVLKRYDLEDKVPTAILSHLQRGEPETPKKEDKIFERVTNIIIGNNRQALYAARDKARELGWTPLILTSEMEGEAKEAAKVFASICKEIRSSSNPMSPPACILAGGETTVTLKGDGRGGRNQEFALAAAMQIKGFEEITILAAGTDGTDGPTEAAGAVVDGKTLSKIDKDPEEYLKNNDSYHFFKDSPCHLITGPTRTNVMDMVIGLVG